MNRYCIQFKFRKPEKVVYILALLNLKPDRSEALKSPFVLSVKKVILTIRLRCF